MMKQRRWWNKILYYKISLHLVPGSFVTLGIKSKVFVFILTFIHEYIFTLTRDTRMLACALHFQLYLYFDLLYQL